MRAAALDIARRVGRAHGAGGAATVEVLGEGEDHRAFLVDDHLVVRVATRDDTAAAAHEARLLEAVAGGVSLPVPRPLAAEEGVLAYERLPGVPVLDVLDAGGWRTPAPVGLGRTLGAFVRELHALDPGLVEVDDVPLAEWRDEAAEHLHAVRGELPASAPDAVARWLAAPLPGRATALVLAHNDLGAEHVLVDPATHEVTGVIDWSDAARTDPARDLGLLLRDLGPTAFEEALAAYDGTALRERAWFYARCGALEDLVYGLDGHGVYARKSLAALPWLFGAGAP